MKYQRQSIKLYSIHIQKTAITAMTYKRAIKAATYKRQSIKL